MRLEAKKSKLSQMIWALGPAAFLQVFSMSHVGTNLLGVCLTTNVTTIQGSWVATIEILMSMLGSLITPYIAQGRPAIFFLMGAIIYGVSNILFVADIFQSNFIAVLSLRCVSSIGMMFYTPLIHQIEKIYSDPSDAISVSASLKVLSAIAAIATPFTGGVVAQIYSWRGMFVIGGVIALIHFFILMAVMDFNVVGEEQIKADLPGSFFVTLAQMALLAGISLLEQKQWSLYCYICFAAAAILYVYFFIHNHKLTANPIIPSSVVNRSNIFHVIANFCNNAARSSESYFIAYVQILIFATPSWLSGSLITYANVSSFLFAPVVNNMRLSVFTKGNIIYMLVIYAVLIALNSMNLLLFPTLFLFTSTNLLCGGFSLLAGGFHNHVLNRVNDSESLADANAFTGLFGSLGASFGVTLSVTLQTFADESYGVFTHNSFCAPFWGSLVLLTLSFISILCIGELSSASGGAYVPAPVVNNEDMLVSDAPTNAVSENNLDLDLIKQFAA